jgi:glutaredoxin
MRILYTLTTCPTCMQLKLDLKKNGIGYEERQVDKNQEWLNEALTYADTVPIMIEGDKVSIGFNGNMG